MKVSKLGEDGLIRRVAWEIRAGRGVVRGIGDDCAVLRWGPSTKLGANETYLLFASDMIVEGVHFRRSARPEAIGWKALAVNVSDVAAMGGLPRHAVVSIGLPHGTGVSFVDGLYRGLRRCTARFGVNLVGGDTVRSPKVVLDVAILGEVERDRVIYRSGARLGDALLVTGRLGGAVRSGRHLTFTPRLKEARALTAHANVHAMMDLSDGLALDLGRLCRASGVGAVLEPARVPRNRGCSLKQALTDGEDFELLLAAPAGEAERLLRWARAHLACGLTRIGRIVKKGRGIPKMTGGFSHF